MRDFLVKLQGGELQILPELSFAVTHPDTTPQLFFYDSSPQNVFPMFIFMLFLPLTH